MADSVMPCPNCLAAFSFSEDAGDPQQCPACREADAAFWFYISERRKIGPVAGNELRRLCQAGKLTRTDMVLRQGETRWTAAHDVPGLFPPLVQTSILPVSAESAPVAPNAIQEVCPAIQTETLTAVTADSSGTEDFISVASARMPPAPVSQRPPRPAGARGITFCRRAGCSRLRNHGDPWSRRDGGGLQGAGRSSSIASSP